MVCCFFLSLFLPWNLFDFITKMCYKKAKELTRLRGGSTCVPSVRRVLGWHITQSKLFLLLNCTIENNRIKETMVKWNEDDLLVFRILIDEWNERVNKRKKNRITQKRSFRIRMYSCLWNMEPRARHHYHLWACSEYATSQCKSVSLSVYAYHAYAAVPCVVAVLLLLWLLLLLLHSHTCMYWHIYLQPRNIEN